MSHVIRRAGRQLAALDGHRERLKDLERDRDALIESYASMLPEALDGLGGEERRTLYRMLRLQVVPSPEGYEAAGVLCPTGPTPPVGSKAQKHRELGFRAQLTYEAAEIEMALV